MLATLKGRAASCTAAANHASSGRFGTLSPIFDKKPAAPGESCANIRDIEVFMARLGKRRRSSQYEGPSSKWLFGSLPGPDSRFPAKKSCSFRVRNYGEKFPSHSVGSSLPGRFRRSANKPRT